MFKTKYRVEPHFTLNGITGQPKNQYRIEYRKWLKWYACVDIEPFDTRAEAQAEIERRAGE